MGGEAYLAESALSDGSVQIEVVEIDIAVEIDGLGAAAGDIPHETIGERRAGGEDRASVIVGEEQNSPNITRVAGQCITDARRPPSPLEAVPVVLPIRTLSLTPIQHSLPVLVPRPPAMSVGLAELATLRELYKSGVLKSAEAASLRHPAKSALLDRVSL